MNLYKLLNLLLNYLKKKNFANNQKLDLIFQNACENGDIISVKQILNKNPDINIESNNNKAFVLACISGNLEIVKLLYDKRPNMNLITYNYFSIKSCAVYGNLKVFIWLYDKLRLNLDNIEICLELSIISGNINIAKFLYNKNSNLDLSKNNNIYTECACRHNHLDIVKWLYNLIGNDIFKFDQNENYLIESSRENNLSIVYWLFNTKPEINIFINNDEAFRSACYNNSIEVAKWFNKLNPTRYYLEIEDHVITHFNVIKTYFLSDNVISIENIDDCCICMNSKCNVITECNHQFCNNCLEKSFKRNQTCPTCRFYINRVDKIKVKKRRKLY